MLIVDELKKNDPQLRLVAAMIAVGLMLLLAGLWWVQVVSARKYQSHSETQSIRTVRVPAVRGKILDCEGRVLAENRARFNLSLYLSDLSGQFQKEYDRLRPVKWVAHTRSSWNFWARSQSTAMQHVRLDQARVDALTWQARYDVADAAVADIAEKLGQPLSLDFKTFQRAYETRLYVPFPILQDLNETQIARFEEHFSGGAANLDVQPGRFYPYGDTAGHLLGYVTEDDSSLEGEDAYFSYRLPDYRGRVGIEGGFDAELHGHAGAEAVLVNNYGYRQSVNMLEPAEPGENVVLTVDLDIQQAAEAALTNHQGADARAAIVVMNVRTGDILAMVSSPPINPVFSANSPEYLADPVLQPQINRATFGSFAPGSIFKPIVALAALEKGLNPNEYYEVQPDPLQPWHGCIYVGRRRIGDTVPPGEYNFRRAIEQSSNSYFIFNGLRTGITNIVKLAEKFRFGEKTGLPTEQETGGIFPSLRQVEGRDWRDGDSANICFGQGQMAVTPIQMAVAYSAIANGGKILQPRLVDRIEPQDAASGETATNFPSGVVRDEIGVSRRSLGILREAMLSETEDPQGSGYPAFHQPDSILNLRVCGKTGTAQVENERNEIVGHNYWFASFAPYENPKYAVVVMVQSQSGGSGGSVCAPIAHDIYAEILKKEISLATPSMVAAAKLSKNG